MKLLIAAGAMLGFVTSLSALDAPLPREADILVGKAVATDGDSLRMGEKRIRLFGIDAVEAAQTCSVNGEAWTCGRAARKALERVTEGKTLICIVRDIDRTRHVAQCMAGRLDINDHMVRRGWAVAYTRYSAAYLPAEIEARAARRALWRTEFERPHDYRARLRAEQAAARTPQVPPSADCNIKGNISRSGTRIFHMPGQADYARTRINEEKGERWFCSPRGAIEAGWRAAKR